MKTRMLSWSFLAFVACTLAANVSAESGKTFFSPRSVNSMKFMHHAGTHMFEHENEVSNRFVLSATTFYQENTNRKNLAKYFFPGGKSELSIRGYAVRDDGGVPAAPGPGADADFNAVPTDISGSNLFIAGTNPTETDYEARFNRYSSKISVRPEIRTHGTVLHAHRYFPELSSRLWASAQWPLLEIVSNANLKEFDRTGGFDHRSEVNDRGNNVYSVAGRASSQRKPVGDEFALNAYEAFNHPFWKYGKITNHQQKKSGFSDLDLCVGYRLNDEFNVYTKLTLPTSQKARAEYLFEPVLGNGSHLAFGGGITFDNNLKSLFDIPTKGLYFHSSLEYQYLFQNKQLRSFDLKKNGSWSRYLPVIDYRDTIYTTKPGINFFTQKLEVTPQHEVNWNNCLNIEINNIVDVEVGYNFWYKHKEKVKLPSWDEDINIGASPKGGSIVRVAPANHSINSPALHAGIADPGAAHRVTADNLDLNSAAHPTSFSHTLYANACLQSSWNKLPFVVALGGSYEIANANKALDKWGIWSKITLNV